MSGAKRAPAAEEYRLTADLMTWTNLVVMGTAAVAVAGLAYVDTSGSFLWWALAVIVPALVVCLQPTTVHLGREAMERRRPFLREQLRYDEVVDVTYVDGTPHRPSFLSRHDNSVPARLTVRGTRRGWTFRGEADRDGDLRTLGNAIERRVRVYQRFPHETLPELVRGDRDVARWTHDLRALLSGENAAGRAGGYRAAPTQPEALLRIAENPTSPEADRIAALVALTPARAGDERVRARIAALAPDTTTPQVRVALDAWLAEDDERLTTCVQSAARASTR